MDAVYQRGSQQLPVALKQRGQEQHRILDIGNGVGTGVLHGKYGPRVFSRQALVRNSQQQRPLPFRHEARHLRFRFAAHTSDGYAAHPARRSVVGVMLALGSFADDAVAAPAQAAKVDGQRNSRQPGSG